MAETKTWLAGFIYRGRAPWESQQPAYHVEVGEYVEIEGREPIILGVKILTPEEAKSVGHALPSVLSKLNASVMAQCQELAELIQAQKAEHADQLNEIRADRDDKLVKAEMAAQAQFRAEREISLLRAALSEDAPQA